MDEYKKYEPIFGSWYLGRLIGKGSFGKVFEITREEFGATYKAALKVISVPQDDDDVKSRLAEGTDFQSVSDYYEEILKEIVNENMIMSRLKGNSNIVSYEDHQIIPHEDGIGYDILIRMELLTPLLDRIIARKLDKGEVIKLGIDMCKALEICHKKDIIHRDIKPQNIFISDNGDFKLGDFGIARTIEKTTGGMSKKGTYKYMAPEVFRGEDYGATVDIYSLGLVLYWLLNGNRMPFLPPQPAKVTANDEETAKMRRFRGEPIPAPAEADPMLAYIIQKACANIPEDRYQTAEQMRRDLESYQEGYIPERGVTADMAANTIPGTENDTVPLFAAIKSAAKKKPAPAGAVTVQESAPTGSVGTAESVSAEKKNASWKDYIQKNRIAAVAGILAAAFFLFFFSVIMILQIAPDSGIAAAIDSFVESITGGRGYTDTEMNPDVYDAYTDVLNETSDKIRTYWWQKDIYDSYANEEAIAADATLPLEHPENRCVAVTDVFGDREPELLFFTIGEDKLAYLGICYYQYGAAETAKFRTDGLYAEDFSPWGQAFFSDDIEKDTKYIIYTGKEADTFYIASSMADDGLKKFFSVKYIMGEDGFIDVATYVMNIYGPNEDDSGVIDDYYIDGNKVDSKEGVAAFAAAADDFDKLLMLSGSDKQNMKVFRKGETEQQYAASYDEALNCLSYGEGTPASDPPEKPVTPENEYTVITKDGVVVREGPGKNYRALDRDELNDEYIEKALIGKKACLKQGSKVLSLGTIGDWMEISAGWICMNYNGETLVRKSSEL